MAGVFWCIYGNKGSGKSYFSVKDYLIPALRQGQRVYTNITGLNRALITQLADITPVQYLVDSIESLSDIIEAFDDSQSCRNAVFIIDEIQNILKQDDKKADLLFQRISISRKQGVSFVLITQVPSKLDYQLRKLADGSSLFKRQYDKGSEKWVVEYRWNQGTPIFDSEEKPLADSSVNHKLEDKFFNTYISYIDNSIVGTESKELLKRTTKIWASRKAKRLYIALAIPLVFCGLAVFMASQLIGTFKNFGKNVGSNSSTEMEDVADDTKENYYCYAWAIETASGFETDVGFFASSSYDSIYSLFVSDGKIYRRCGS